MKASHMGLQGFLLLDWIKTDRPALLELEPVQLLRRVWEQQFEPAEPGELPDLREQRGRATEDRIESPYDPDAHCRTRRSTRWTGYVVHLSETCDKDLPRIITHAHTTTANVHEAECTQDIHEALTEKRLQPGDHLADSAYIDAEHLADAKAQGIRLIGPTRKDTSWQAGIEEAFDRSQFTVDYDRQVVTCPMEKTSASWAEYENESRGRYVKARFATSDCQNCYYRILCTKSTHRTLMLHPKEQDEALREARQRMATKKGKRLYQLRAGVEAAISQGVRAVGLRRSPCQGLAKTRLQHLASAAALNLLRMGAWLEGRRPSPTRVSAFSQAAA